MAASKTAKKRARGAKPSQRKAKTVQFASVWSVAFLILVSAIVASGLGVVHTAQDTRALYKSLGEVQREHDQLLEEHSRLSLERSTMSSLQKIETVALEQLDMEFPAHIGRLEYE